jgi:hypothetical protein
VFLRVDQEGNLLCNTGSGLAICVKCLINSVKVGTLANEGGLISDEVAFQSFEGLPKLACT